MAWWGILLIIIAVILLFYIYSVVAYGTFAYTKLKKLR